MATKVLELDLSEGITAIAVSEGYDLYRILIRTHRQPVGWILLPAPENEFISVSELHQAIQQQLGWQVMQQAFAGYLGIRNNIQAPSEYISVVVCTRNRTEQLAFCLKSLSELQYHNYEIIVVDNAPQNDETFQLVQNMNVRYVREDNPGLDRARNRGIEEARHGIIAFTDDDVCVDPYWLQAIAKAFINPAVMAVTGYVAPAELETPAQNLFEFSYGGMAHGFHRRIISRQYLSETQLIWASNFGIGANMSFRTDIFSKIGFFDVALDVGTPSCGGGDIEMFHRLVMNGYQLVYEPAILVWHSHRKSTAALKKQIFNNGRSFGCYLITCYNNRSVKRSSIIEFFLINWFFQWNFKNLLNSGIPKKLSLIELYGMITSPVAYNKSQAHAKRIDKMHLEVDGT